MKPPKRVKIKGSIGSWTAEVEGMRLASLHNTFWVGKNDYFAPSDRAHIPGGKKYEDFVSALESSDLVVLQRDSDPITLRNNGYVGVYRISKLKIDSSGVRLQFTEKYAESIDKAKRQKP